MKIATSIIALAILLTLSTSAFTEEYSLPPLPDGKIIYNEQEEETGILFSKEEYKDIVHMYNNLSLFYENDNLWRKMHTAGLELQRIQHERLILCLETRDTLEITADDMYSLWQEEHELRVSSLKKEKAKKIFIGLGAGAIGALLGAGITALLTLR